MRAAKFILTAVASSLLWGGAQAADETAAMESVIVSAVRFEPVPKASINWSAVARATIDFDSIEIARPESTEHEAATPARRIELASAEDDTPQS